MLRRGGELETHLWAGPPYQREASATTQLQGLALNPEPEIDQPSSPEQVARELLVNVTNLSDTPSLKRSDSEISCVTTEPATPPISPVSWAKRQGLKIRDLAYESSFLKRYGKAAAKAQSRGGSVTGAVELMSVDNVENKPVALKSSTAPASPHVSCSMFIPIPSPKSLAEVYGKRKRLSSKSSSLFKDNAPAKTTALGVPPSEEKDVRKIKRMKCKE